MLSNNDKSASFEIGQGSKVIGRMTMGNGCKVEVAEIWYEGDTVFEVSIDGRRVHSTEDRTQAIRVGHWWLDGCPA